MNVLFIISCLFFTIFTKGSFLLGIPVLFMDLQITKFVDEMTDHEIHQKIKMKPLVVLTGIAATLLSMKYQLSVQYCFYLFLSVQLIFIAYVDLITLKIYRMINVITGCVGFIFFLLNTPDSFVWYILLFYLFLISIFTFFKFFGLGDSILFFSISLYLLPLLHYYNGIVVLLLNIFMSLLVSVIIFFRKCVLSKNKSKERIPLGPGIAISTILIILLSSNII